MTDAELQTELDEMANRLVYDEPEDCPDCDFISYYLAHARSGGGGKPDGYRCATNVAAYVKPCAEHATPYRKFAWVADVPVDAFRMFRTATNGSFAIHELKKLALEFVPKVVAR